MSRIITVNALVLNKVGAYWPRYQNTSTAYIRGNYFYIWHDDHLVKHRYLGQCVNKFAIRIATLKEDIWS